MIRNIANSTNELISPWRTPVKRNVIIFCYAASAAILLVLFFQNFLFSKELGRISLRSVDDLAFQIVLRSVHTALEQGDLSKLLIINDYAYGWFYWAPLGLMTYPLYLLSSHVGVDWPLVVLPRQLSLIFTFGAAFFLRRTVRLLTSDDAVCAIAVLTYLLFPAVAYFSMRFGTVTAIAFFSALSVYLLLRRDDSSFFSLAPPVIALAAAGAIKLSGLLIAPFLMLIILRRLGSVPRLVALGTLCALGLLFVGLLLILTNPGFLLAPFNPKILSDYLNTLSYFVGVTQVGGTNTGMLVRFYEAVFDSSLNAAAAFLLAIGLLIGARFGVFRRDVCFVAFVTLLVATVYLIVGIKSESSAGSYFLAVSFLLVAGVVGWQRVRYGSVALFLIPLLLVGDIAVKIVLQINSQVVSAERPWNHASYFIYSARSRSLHVRSDFIENCIAADSGTKPISHIFYDYEVAPPFNSLTLPSTCFSVAWGNLSPDGAYCDNSRPVQYILLNKHALGFAGQTVFDKWEFGASPGAIERVRRDREIRKVLLERGTFGDKKFAKLCANPDVFVFKALQ